MIEIQKNIICSKSIVFFILVILTFNISKVQAQVTDSIRTRNLVVKSILPISLITSGIIINNTNFEKQFQEDIRDRVGEDFSTSLDSYLQYAPIAEMYIADLAGVKSKNHWFDQTKYLFISNVISSMITYGLKSSIYKTRPDNSENNSFPSGHTTVAFTNASVLYHEFNDSSTWLAYSGYVFSTTTATLRVLNNEHWLSDVIMGAGIGIIVTNLVYYFEPFKNFNPFLTSRKFTLVPVVENNKYGAYFSYSF